MTDFEQLENAAYPLNDAQTGVFLECAENPDSVKYNIPVRARLPEKTDLPRLISAVKTVCEKHPALFVTIAMQNGVPVMVCRKREVTVEETSAESFDAEFRRFLRPFDLENGPLFRFEILHTPEDNWLFYDVHHLIYDGTSQLYFIRQIAEVYAGAECPEEDMTLFEEALAEQQKKDPEKLERYRAFFERKLADADADVRPLPDRISGDVPDKSGAIVLDSDEKFTDREVDRFVHAAGITRNALFLGAFGYTLAKYNGTSEVLFNTAHNGRLEKRLASTMGMFVKMLPFSCRFDEHMPVADYLRSVAEDYAFLKNNDVIPYPELAARYGVNTDVSFVYQGELLGGAPLEDGVLFPEDLSTGTPVSDLEFTLLKRGERYHIDFYYRETLYTEEFMRGFAEMFLNTVRGMLTAETLGEIPLTDEASLAQLDRFNRTEADYDAGTTVVAEFRAQAAKTPDAVCLVYDGKCFTYHETDEITDRLAAALVRKGVCKETVTGILIPRCEYMLICALGVLKAGGAYLPLDPTYPPERLNLMMQDSGAMLLIADPALVHVITDEFRGARMLTDEIPALPPCDLTLPVPQPEDLFVVLYTSGSTGTPKGVMYQHSNALVTTEWVKKYFDINETSALTAYASYGFDANVFDSYPAVTSGAALHIIPDEIRLDFPALRDYFNENGITHTVMTTQVGRQFAQMRGLKTLRHISVAGEKLTPPEVPEGFILYNLYGPSEGSVVTSAFRIERRCKDVPIGKPVDNLKAYVVDKEWRLLPPGAVGELWIAGPHVTRGYLNRPEKTAEAYGDGNPFTDQAGYERIYRTGDIVRFLPDGNLQYVGRRDAQVKVRGFRVELTEIEEVIRRYPGIKDATVAAFDDASGGKYVCAYVVADEEISAAALSDFIRAEKPPYMVPAVIMQIEAIPLNQNQKVNRKALPVPERKAEDMTPPENELQQRIYDIAAEVLGHKAFGINTDLYEAGLTSIGSMRLNTMLAEELNVPVKIADIRENDTIRKLAGFFASREAAKSYPLRQDYPLTETQKGIFVECMTNPGTTIYNIPVLLRLGAGVEPARLLTAVRAAIDAHPYMKTELFTDAEGNVRAKRQDSLPANAELVTCETLPAVSGLRRPFELLGQPLYRAAVYETADGNYLYLDLHHIISDGTGETVLLRDIERAYAGEALEPETFTGFEAALAEAELRSSGEYDNAVLYWTALLSGSEGTSMPAKAPDAGMDGAGFLRRAGSRDATAIRNFCAENKLSLNAFFNAVFSLVLSRFTGKEQVNYTTIHSGRNDSRLVSAVTMLVKTIPMAASVSGETGVADHIRNLQSQLISSMAHDALSFAEQVTRFGVDARLMFICQAESYTFDNLCGEKSELIELPPDTPKSALAVNVYPFDDHFEYTVEYDSRSYSRAFAESLIDSLMTAAAAFPAGKQLKDISILSDDAEKLYSEMNDSDIAVEPTYCHQFAERFARKTPDTLAVIANGETLTFRELNEKANIMAHRLLELGAGAETIIGLVLERSKEVMITELAIMKAGGAFLPMVPSYPDERIDFCLMNAESPFVITSEALEAQKPELFAEGKPYRTLVLEDLLSGSETEDLNLPVDPGQMAYCIYTSGSTGTPKGVMIEHHNLSNFVQTDKLLWNYYMDDSARGACLAASSISFDMSVTEMWLTLCSGKTVCMATEEEFHNPLLLRDLMLKNNVQCMACTPSFLNNMLSMPGFDEALRGLRTAAVGAEAFPAGLFERLRAIAPELQIINGYGPTETTMCSSNKEITSDREITIGRPIGNMKYFVLDPFGHIQPPYAAGELIICGAGVSRGYVKLPEKNAACFFRLRGLPAYRSGDNVRLTAKAEIEFCGRLDNQVKLRGFRIELDEIEKVMCSFGTVKQSKVLVRNNGSEDYLAGFFTASEPVDLEELTKHLKSRLTYYMVPAVLMQLEQMPLTPNGKIDKNAFPETTGQRERRSGGRKAAKKSLEQRLCEIFASVLDLDEVYADDNFFELGGTSLSASKVTMLLMSDNIEAKYGDIFSNPTPETLAAFLQSRDAQAAAPAAPAAPAAEPTREALKHNMVKYANEVKREPLGNVLLTGATGFLGIHVLKELLEIEVGHIFCLVRKGDHESPEVRLRSMLFYYFSDGFDEAFRSRLTLIDADITDNALGGILADVPFDTVINCAACVKHFADDDIIERINVRGVENLIAVCRQRDRKLIQISTTSIPGIHTPESYEKQVKMHENELFVIDDMDNKYGISKYHAELRMFDAIEAGMRGKVIRAGNLMGRHSDGEFQANLSTNLFLSGIRGFATMGKYPISHMTDPMRFSPVDCTAKAIVLLSGTNDEFTAFNCDNRYGFDEMKIIDACNRNGIPILPADDEAYYEEYRRKLSDGSVNSRLNGLAAYDIPGVHSVETDNLFTTNILYRIGFSWPLVDDAYLDRAIDSIKTMDFFEPDSTEET